MIPVIVPVLALLAIAFFTLMERNGLAYTQERNGPNKVGSGGVLQPFADALNLFANGDPNKQQPNNPGFVVSSALAILLALFLWGVAPTDSPSLLIPNGTVILLLIISFNVYWVLGAGWASNSNFSLLGSLRSVAQTISYEIPIALILWLTIIIHNSTSIHNIEQWHAPSLVIIALPALFIWIFCMLAETSRTPFDHAEGESELVSGFNTEYGAGRFALLFIAEYLNILILCFLTAVLFVGVTGYLALSIAITITGFTVWIRSTVPRIRYDSLIENAWIIVLPASLSVVLIVVPVVL